MKLDPIFVVAPPSSPRSMPTRRAFLIAGSTFTLGTAVGGACGYSIAAAASGSNGAAIEESLEPSGDFELDELRRLAVKAPIEELLEKRLVFVNSLTKDYPMDRVLWRGVDRLSAAVLGGQAITDRRLFCRFLAQVIEQGDPQLALPLMTRVRELRKQE